MPSLAQFHFGAFSENPFLFRVPWDAEPSLENTTLHLCHLRRSW